MASMFGVKQSIEGSKLFKFVLTRTNPGSSPEILTFEEVLNLWQVDTQFVDLFNQVLQDVPFPAFFWETPSVTPSKLQEPFEFIVQESKHLASVTAEYSPFSGHLSEYENTNTVLSFPNLGKDSVLVVPCLNGSPAHYASIATFVRNAPQEQVRELWKTTGRQALKRIEERQGAPVWISTAGTGVYWLHVRLDNRPKYYTYGPYRR